MPQAVDWGTRPRTRPHSDHLVGYASVPTRASLQHSPKRYINSKGEYQPYSASHHSNNAYDRGISRDGQVLLRKASFVILFTSLRPSIDWSSFNTSVHIKQWRFCPPSIVIPRIASRHWVVMVFWGRPHSRLSGSGSISIKIHHAISHPTQVKNLESSQV